MYGLSNFLFGVNRGQGPGSGVLIHVSSPLQGGGNCGNALTAAARLGASTAILTVTGDDAAGDGIVRSV